MVVSVKIGVVNICPESIGIPPLAELNQKIVPLFIACTCSVAVAPLHTSLIIATGFKIDCSSAFPLQFSSTKLQGSSDAPGLTAALVSSQSVLLFTYPVGCTKKQIDKESLGSPKPSLSLSA